MEYKLLSPIELAKLQQRVWQIAKAHGWHEERISTGQCCGLIMTEIAEAVEADRNGSRARTNMMIDALNSLSEGGHDFGHNSHEDWFEAYYISYVKDSVEEEFADVIIRLLDTAQEIHEDKMQWFCSRECKVFRKGNSFIENAWYFVSEVLNWGMINISESIIFMYDWATDLDIDLYQHVEWKMRYNEHRPYKHGGKKY